MEVKEITSWTHGECRTGAGQLVHYTYYAGNKDNIRNFIFENLRSIDTITTGVFNIEHGGYGRYTRYDMKQHKYAGGGSGFIEVLEVRNAPDGRCPFIIYQYHEYGHTDFTEWDTLENACEAFEKYWSSDDNSVNFPKAKGFKRWIECGALCPWFYAIGEEELINDYSLPHGLEDDPVYRLGKKFVVFDNNGLPSIKTCMGSRFFKAKKKEYYRSDDYYPDHRVVYFDDGSVWNDMDSEHKRYPPRELKTEEIWMSDAIHQFQQLLAGKQTEFTINFINGKKFVGKIVDESGKSFSSPEGDYILAVTFKDKKNKPQQGSVTFKPTEKYPNIIAYATAKFIEKDMEPKTIRVIKVKSKQDGRKWQGFFYSQ